MLDRPRHPIGRPAFRPSEFSFRKKTLFADKGCDPNANPDSSSPREFQRPQVLGQLFRAAGIFEQIKVDLKRRGQQSFRTFAPSET